MKQSQAEVRRRKIGVLDSGVGGLTVVKELRRLLPQEDILYYGDNKNCPYGNRTEEEIISIARHSIGFLREHGAKLVVLACNTTSSLLQRFAGEYPFPIFSIVKPVADFVAARRPAHVGVIATELTIRTGIYGRLIREGSPETQVLEEPSRNLAKLVDCGEFDMPAIAAEVEAHVNALLRRQPVEQIIYGCTHYPIVHEVFEQAAPQVDFLNPAIMQAQAVERYLRENNLGNDAPEHSFALYTSGSRELFPVYQNMLNRLGIDAPVAFHSLEEDE